LFSLLFLSLLDLPLIRFDFSAVETFNGSLLHFWRLDRRQMGAVLGIASNDVPPAVSKRIILNVNCKYPYNKTGP
jgi:hypothetical protein